MVLVDFAACQLVVSFVARRIPREILSRNSTVAVKDSVVKMAYTIGHSKMLKIYRLRCKKMNIIVKFDDI